MSRRKRGAGRIRGSSGAGTITPPPPAGSNQVISGTGNNVISGTGNNVISGTP